MKELSYKKIRLSTKFPKAILYLRRNAIDLGLIRPKIAIVMQVYKLYLENLRV